MGLVKPSVQTRFKGMQEVKVCGSGQTDLKELKVERIGLTFSGYGWDCPDILLECPRVYMIVGFIGQTFC